MQEPAKILYNAQCPVCNLEISHYAKYADDKALPLRFEDLNTTDLSAWDLTPDQAARRLYLLKDGELYDGIPAFLKLWADMPRYRLLGQVVGLPVIRQIASAIYDYALAPTIYHWYKRRQRKAAKI